MGRTTRRAAVSTEDEEPSSAEEEDEEEEEHSSSGEESSGEEDSGDEQLKRKPATAEGPTGAQKREAHQRALREAKAANAKAGKSRDKAAIAKAKTVELEKARLAKQRVEFLLSKADVFQKFLGPEAAAGAGAGAKKGGRRRLTEREGDESFMKGEAQQKETIPRLTNKQTASLIAHGKMRDYQVEGLNWLIRSYHRGLNGILADEMGLGKTLQSISLLAYLHKFENISGPHLIVVPKTTLGNWVKEFAQWYPALRVLKFFGTQDERALIRERDLQFGKFDVCILSYEVAISEKASLTKFPWEYLMIDEAHRIKNENSVLSQIIRLYNTKCRLLITGTPLQNNLHELWALLNFLLPDVFSDSQAFDPDVLDGGGGSDSFIHQLHAVLRPFILRRLKMDVERGMPPKTELTVYCQLAKPQLRTYKAVLKNHVDVLNSGPGGEKTKLLNIVMQLRKAANHPYLFDGVEDKSLDPFGEHLVEHSGKLRLLDKLIPRLQTQGSRILIFSQMTRMLDILDDYCAMRSHSFCRIDGQTSCEDRDRQIEEFNAPKSQHSVFLLSTRAGGLGINLTTADIVILYDSDWNPQMDLQAQDRAHRIGQKKPVKVFRLITEHTIEERILSRALQKLKLDALVIQSGGLVEKEKANNKDDLLAAIRCGADAIFRAKDSDELVDEDIDAILARAEKQTKDMAAEMASLDAAGPSANALDSRAWKFGGDSDDEDEDQAEQFIDIGKRDRKAAAPTNIAAPVVFKAAPMLPPSDIDSLMTRPVQTFPSYKDLVLLALADPSIGEDAATAQKMIAAAKRKYPAMEFKKKNWATALAKAVDVGTVTETKNGPKWGGNKYRLSGARGGGEAELEKANDTESRRRSREEIDESKPPVDAEDTPWPGWTMRTYFMADRGEIKHYLPPQSAPTSQPEGDSSAAVDEPGNDGGDADDDDDQDEDEDADEVERVLEKRITEKGENEFKVRWKRYTAEDDTWEPEGNLAGCRELIAAFLEKRRLKEAMAPPPVITSMQKLLGFIRTRPECLAAAGNDQEAFLKGFGWVVSTRSSGPRGSSTINWNNTDIPDPEKSKAQFEATQDAATASTSIKAVAKLMLASHVSGGFWLQLPTSLGEVLPDVQGGVKMMLQEKESMDVWEVVWLRKGKKGGGLSGGWRGFAIDLELNAGDSVLFEYLGSKIDKADRDADAPGTLLATVNRAIPLEDNPNRVIVKLPAKGPSVVSQDGSIAAAAKDDGKPKMRRTTQIVKRENKLRNAILAGDTNFSYAAARAESPAKDKKGKMEKEEKEEKTEKPPDVSKKSKGATKATAEPAPKRSKVADGRPKATDTAGGKKMAGAKRKPAPPSDGRQPAKARKAGKADTAASKRNAKGASAGIGKSSAAAAIEPSMPCKGARVEVDFEDQAYVGSVLKVEKKTQKFLVHFDADDEEMWISHGVNGWRMK